MNCFPFVGKEAARPRVADKSAQGNVRQDKIRDGFGQRLIIFHLAF